MKSTLKYLYALNEKGRKTHLEDHIFPPVSLATNLSERVFMVCNGISGGERAETASRLLGEHFYDYFTQKPFKGEKLGQIYVNEALRYAERKMSAHTKQYPTFQGMESGLALVYFNDNGTISAVWVGNSRVYHIRKGQVLYRTEDHVSNVWQGSKSTVVPRAVSGVEPVWASVTILNEVLADDYILVCTPGVVEALDDRNLKYLFSQATGNDSTNQAIIAKISEMSAAHSQNSFGAFLLQLDKTPFYAEMFGTMPAPNNTPQSGLVKRPVTAPPSGKINMDLPPPRQVSFDPQKLVQIILLALALSLAVGLGFLLKNWLINPDRDFQQQITQAETLVEAGNYEDAITAFETAINMEVRDTSLRETARRQLNHARCVYLIAQGDEWIKSEDYIKAKSFYEQALQVDVQNSTAQHKIDSIDKTLSDERKELLSNADSLMRIHKYSRAKEYLFDALYIDQKDSRVLKQLNQCNNRLRQDSLTMEDAVKQASMLVQQRGATLIGIEKKMKKLKAEQADSIAQAKAAAAAADTLPKPPKRNSQNDDYNYSNQDQNYNQQDQNYTRTYYPASGGTYTGTTPSVSTPVRQAVPTIEPIKPNASTITNTTTTVPDVKPEIPKPDENIAPKDTIK